MNLKSLIYFILLLLYCLICWKYYTCRIKGFCSDSNTAEIKDQTETGAPVLFYKNTDMEVLSNFESYRDSICALSHSTRLDIVGQYYADEVNTTSFEDLGLARAYKLKKLLLSCGIDTSKIAVISQKIDASAPDSINTTSVITPSIEVNTSSSDVQIITNHGKTEIYFPTNSTEELKNDALDKFLKEIALESATKQIVLIGHTDNVGPESTNQVLSINRCTTIKAKLIKFGANPDHVICEGKGSTAPKVDNSTEENRTLNRRVEVTYQ
jgi:OmpA-OmpF porin, OOP family